ncbi:proline dehydrogenase family protein [Cohnella sp. JJ-181]|uniref:proline dehydrogenase family protein n=1 Tax=Cohnella rhizoplanae TaxID=2974897 RepID=UPI0022FF8ECC|nr:proline dehydrogenase family protein [Cohnella sp. JJ-181]CAI6032777.1 Proline dehydrogenase 1 [Cohnella sp. JJ-181]
MSQQTPSEKALTQALKSIARDARVKERIRRSPEGYALFMRAAKKYVTGERREDGIEAGVRLASKGYKVSLEYIGENTSVEAECEAAAGEFSALIRDCGRLGLSARISLDLSHIGLAVSPALARDHLSDLAREAQSFGLELVVSMEESEKTNAILDVYKQVSPHFSNVGITLQAQLNRTPADVKEVLGCPGTIRIVKGAYQEPPGICLPRSDALNERYLALLDTCMAAGQAVSVATQDEALIERVLENSALQKAKAEFEMLYGIRPDLAGRLRSEGHPVRLYLTYGTEWYLYLCHRIAEHPPNLYDAVVDMINGAPDRTDDYR